MFLSSFHLYVLSIIVYGSELWIFYLKTYSVHTKAVRSKYRAAWKALNDVYMMCARRILGAPVKTSSDAVLVRLGWMPLDYVIMYRTVIWVLKGRRNLAGPALYNLCMNFENNTL